MLKNILYKKLTSGALQLAVIISFIVVLLCSFFIFYLNISSSFIDKEQLLLRQIRNTNSLINESLCALSLENKSLVELYNNQDSIKLDIQPWGAYKIIQAQTFGSVPIKQSFLIGNSPDTLTALYVLNDEQYLALGGNTVIKGTLYAPKLGVRAQMVGNKGFSGKYGIVEESKKELPALSSEFVEQIQQYYKLLQSFSSPVILVKDSLVNSFFEETIVLANSEFIPSYMRGNIILVDDSKIELTATMNCKDIICVAPFIKVEDGFKGNVQLFATDSIIIESGAKLAQASFLAVINNDMQYNDKLHITIEKNARICGGIYFKAPQYYKNYSGIILDEDATCIGEVYSENAICNKGRICGSAYAKQFYSPVRNGIKVNMLFNSKFAAVPSNLHYVSPVLIERNASWNKIRKLY